MTGAKRGATGLRCLDPCKSARLVFETPVVNYHLEIKDQRPRSPQEQGAIWRGKLGNVLSVHAEVAKLRDTHCAVMVLSPTPRLFVIVGPRRVRVDHPIHQTA